MALRAIISDLHGNLEATRAVLDDAHRQGVQDIICLGDLVNYGPDPVECLRLAPAFSLTVMGNNEHALLAGPQHFRSAARRALDWTRRRLLESFSEQDLTQRLRRFPLLHRDGATLFVHGSPRDPLNEYVSYRDAQSEDGRAKLQAVFREMEGVSVCFCGHTHAPGVIARTARTIAALGGEQLPSLYEIGAGQVIVVVGSVGHPRDHRTGASYVIEDTEARVIQFRRVEYAVERTAAKALRELYLWSYACQLMCVPPTPDSARSLADTLAARRLLTPDECAEVRYFLKLAEPEEIEPHDAGP